jgi:transcriptional regulator with XRE-family HTH domain
VTSIEPADLALAAAIRGTREAGGWTQEDVAHGAGLTVGSYARIERGQANPAWTTVKRIAGALDTTTVDLAASAARHKAR